MKTLLILRHGKSSWRHAGLADHDRPLKKRGRRDAPRMGELLRDEDLVPDMIITSSAERARQTAALVAEASGYDGDVLVTEILYHADSEDHLAVLSGLDDGLERVMLVGHNPGMELLVEDLCEDYEPMPTAALAHIEVDVEAWRDVLEMPSCQLKDLWRPRELGG